MSESVQNFFRQIKNCAFAAESWKTHFSIINILSLVFALLDSEAGLLCRSTKTQLKPSLHNCFPSILYTKQFLFLSTLLEAVLLGEEHFCHCLYSKKNISFRSSVTEMKKFRTSETRLSLSLFISSLHVSLLVMSPLLSLVSLRPLLVLNYLPASTLLNKAAAPGHDSDTHSHTHTPFHIQSRSPQEGCYKY